MGELDARGSVHYYACGWDDTAAVTLARSLMFAHRHGYLQRVKCFSLYDIDFGNEGAGALAQAFHNGCLPALEGFHITDAAEIDDIGCSVLLGAAEKAFSKLQDLTIEGTTFGDVSLCALIGAAEKGAFSKLQYLGLWHNSQLGGHAPIRLAKAMDGGAFPDMQDLSFEFAAKCTESDIQEIQHLCTARVTLHDLHGQLERTTENCTIEGFVD